MQDTVPQAHDRVSLFIVCVWARVVLAPRCAETPCCASDVIFVAALALSALTRLAMLAEANVWQMFCLL